MRDNTFGAILCAAIAAVICSIIWGIVYYNISLLRHAESMAEQGYVEVAELLPGHDFVIRHWEKAENLPAEK